jgi:acyl carrier protein
MTEDEIKKIIIEIFKNNFSIEHYEFEFKDFFLDIGLNSIDFMLTVVLIEEKINRDIDDAILAKPFSTICICDLVDIIIQGD